MLRHGYRPLIDELYSRTRPGSSKGSGETVASVTFTFATISPLVLQSVAAGNVLNRLSILIQTPFNDPAATLEVGTSADPSLVFNTSEIKLYGPLSGLTYDNSQLFEFTLADLLLLTLSPGASTMGAGLLLYKLKG